MNSNQPDNKTYYILRAHNVTSKVLHLYQQVARVSKTNTLILFDITNYHSKDATYETKATKIIEECQNLGFAEISVCKFDQTLAEHNHRAITFVTVSEADCIALNSLHNVGREQGSLFKIEGHMVAISKFLSANTHIFDPMEYMWFIEYDVHCHGSFKTIFDKVANSKADLLMKGSDDTNEIRTVINEPYWVWWENGLQGEIAAIHPVHRRGGFLPIMRVSNRFVKCIEHNLGTSSGFFEIYLPTLCYLNKLSLEALPEDIFGMFTWRQVHMSVPAIEYYFEPTNILFHPVKTM